MQPKPTPTLSWHDALELYHGTYLPSRNYAARTRSCYLDDLRYLVAFLRKRQRQDPADATLSDLESFLAHLDRRGLAGASRRRKTYACKSFFAYLHRSGAISDDPSLWLVPPRTEQAEPRVLSMTEYEALLRACSHHPRDAAIIELLLQTGIRLSELAGLRLGDVELPKRITKEAETVGRLRILGKGRKARWIPLNYKACRAIKTWLESRHSETEALFISKFGKPLGPRGIQRLVHKYMSEVGITRASVHTLRHTFATHHVARGTSLRTVQEVLGHASLKTTSIYVQLAQEAVKRELQEHAL